MQKSCNPLSMKITQMSVGKPSTLSLSVADVNSDGLIDASDASYVLAYYAYYSSGGSGTIQDFINKQ